MGFGSSKLFNIVAIIRASGGLSIPLDFVVVVELQVEKCQGLKGHCVLLPFSCLWPGKDTAKGPHGDSTPVVKKAWWLRLLHLLISSSTLRKARPSDSCGLFQHVFLARGSFSQLYPSLWKDSPSHQCSINYLILESFKSHTYNVPFRGLWCRNYWMMFFSRCYAGGQSRWSDWSLQTLK